MKANLMRQKRMEASFAVFKLRMLLANLGIVGLPATFIDWHTFAKKYKVE